MAKRQPTLVPDPEPTEAPSEETPTPTYTLGDQVRANTKLIRELADEYDIDPAAVIQLFGITMNVHFTKIQLGLAAPVEG